MAIQVLHAPQNVRRAPAWATALQGVGSALTGVAQTMFSIQQMKEREKRLAITEAQADVAKEELEFDKLLTLGNLVGWENLPPQAVDRFEQLAHFSIRDPATGKVIPALEQVLKQTQEQRDAELFELEKQRRQQVMDLSAVEETRKRKRFAAEEARGFESSTGVSERKFALSDKAARARARKFPVGSDLNKRLRNPEVDFDKAMRESATAELHHRRMHKERSRDPFWAAMDDAFVEQKAARPTPAALQFLSGGGTTESGTGFTTSRGSQVTVETGAPGATRERRSFGVTREF